MVKLNVKNETSALKAVIVGIANSNGEIPTLAEAYDPKSTLHIKKGTYPKEPDMVSELDNLAKVLEGYNVKVYRPNIIDNYNQIFSRDMGFVIDDVFVKANILPARDREITGISHVLDQIDGKSIISLPEDCHIEGGDVILYNDYVFIGTYSGNDYPDYITARTNVQAVNAIEDLFPNKKVKSFELRKSNTNPKENALHLDCCFQPIGRGKAILHKNGFLNASEYEWLLRFFGKENIYEITKEEMYDMNSNIFSVSEDVIISEVNFKKLNHWLRSNDYHVEAIPFSEIAKQEGLLRCCTLPLLRD